MENFICIGMYVTCVCVCVCVCVCACARVMERLLPQFQAWLISAWCSVHEYTYIFANVQMYVQCIKIVLGMLYKPIPTPNT